MNLLDDYLDAKVREDRKLLVPFVTAGFPREKDTVAIARALVEAGADALELGIPFSDPLADGPVIQKASQRALEGGMTLAKALALAEKVVASVDVPVLVMGYANPIERMGPAKFAKACANAGITGAIVPDLPIDEADDLRAAFKKERLHFIPLAAPTTRDDRLALLGKATTAFLYCVSVAGTTGSRGALPEHLASFLARARRVTKRPRLVGFGISNAATARAAASVSEGVIVGSALLEAIGADEKDPARAAKKFLAPLRRALDQPSSSRATTPR